MDFQPFHALRTWKVHVVIFSFHQATHFHTLLTPLDFQYVNTWFDFRYTMLLLFTHCLPPSTSGMLTQNSTSGTLIRQRPWMNHSDSGVLGMYWYCREKFCLGQLWESKSLLNMLSHKVGLDKLKGNHWLLSTEVVNYLYHISSDKCPGACSNFWLKKEGSLIENRALYQGRALIHYHPLSSNASWQLNYHRNNWYSKTREWSCWSWEVYSIYQ